MDELLMQAKRLVMTAENAVKTRNGQKWHTRRVPFQDIVPDWSSPGVGGIRFKFGTFAVDALTQGHKYYEPSYIREIVQHASYQEGDLCWIAEPYQIEPAYSFPAGSRTIVRGLYGDCSYFSVTLTEQETAKFRKRRYPYRYSPGRFMYKSLARTIVRIKRVWVEQVQDIDIEDAVAEGYPFSWTNAVSDGLNAPQAIEWFHELWDLINKSRGYGWDVNPLVYVYEYELVKKLR